MAQGDVTLFNQYKVNLGEVLLDMSSDAFKLGLVTNSVTPAASTADPRWGAGGTTNLLSNECTPGGNYTTGGPTIGSTTWTESSGTVTFDGSDVTINSNASNPNNARWGIIYDNTDTGKRCVAFLDLGGVTDLTAGNLTVTWSASGIFSLT